MDIFCSKGHGNKLLVEFVFGQFLDGLVHRQAALWSLPHLSSASAIYLRVISLMARCLRVMLSSLQIEAAIWQLTDDNFHRGNVCDLWWFSLRIPTADLITMAGFYSLENKEVIRIKVKVSFRAFLRGRILFWPIFCKKKTSEVSNAMMQN